MKAIRKAHKSARTGTPKSLLAALFLCLIVLLTSCRTSLDVNSISGDSQGLYIGKGYFGQLVFGSHSVTGRPSTLADADELARNESLILPIKYEGFAIEIYGTPAVQSCASQIRESARGLFQSLNKLKLLSALEAYRVPDQAQVNIHFIDANNFEHQGWNWPWQTQLDYYFPLEHCQDAASTTLNAVASVQHELVHLIYINRDKNGVKALTEELMAYRAEECVRLATQDSLTLTLPAWVEDYEDENLMLVDMQNPYAGVPSGANKDAELSYRAALLTTYRMYKHFGRRDLQPNRIAQNKIQAFCLGENI